MRFKTLGLLFGAFFTLSAAPAFAQFKASIQGTVMDPKGAAVANAKVVITDQATALTHEGDRKRSGLLPAE